MTEEEIKAAILAEIDNIAPGSIPNDLDPESDMRETMDLDSMDMLNLLAALHKRLGVDVPEADAPKLVTLNGAVTYLATRLA